MTGSPGCRFVTVGGGILLVIIVSIYIGMNIKKVWRVVLAMQRNTAVWACILALCFFQTMIFQVYQDAVEKSQLENGVYWPLKYRWAVPVMKLVW
jgi:hypothetical protein